MSLELFERVWQRLPKGIHPPLKTVILLVKGAFIDSTPLKNFIRDRISLKIVDVTEKRLKKLSSNYRKREELQKIYLCYANFNFSKRRGKIISTGELWLFKDRADIYNIWTHPLFRRLSLAREILNLLLLKARDLHLKEVYLFVQKDNYPALRLYLEMGFQFVERRRHLLRMKVSPSRYCSFTPSLPTVQNVSTEENV